jgi:hypothetical protein
MRRLVLALVAVTCGCGPSAEEEARYRAAQEKFAAERMKQLEAAQHVAAVKAAEEKKIAEERSIKSGVEYAAKKIVEDEIKKKTWGELPKKWWAEGKVIRQEDDRFLVLVHTGSKDGWLDDPLVIRSFCVAVQHDRERKEYRWLRTAIQPCDQSPTEKQIRTAIVSNMWPGAIKQLVDEAKAEAEAKKARRVGKRRVAVDDE